MSPARRRRREFALPKKETVLLLSLTPQAWRRSQIPCLEASTIGRQRQVCERWIYSAGLCFALDLEEQERSGFRYQYSNSSSSTAATWSSTWVVRWSKCFRR